MKKGNARLLSILVCLAMIIGMLPVAVSAEYDAEGTTYVRVNSVEDLVPNARYVILGEYEAEGVETDYFAMSTDVNTYDDIRVGLTSTTYATEENPNFVLSEDKQSLTLHSDSILKVRLRKATYGTHENLYKMEVDDQGYVYGFCNSYYYYSTSCCRELAVRTSTKGQSWWRFGMGDNGYWQISTFMRANGDTSIVSLVFNDVYRDFMSYCYVNGSGLEPELAFFQNYTEDKDTNILLYREVCTHKAANVTHIEGAAATCEKGGKLEHWYCAGCETYFADEDLTQTMQFVDTYIPAPAHTAGCGHTPSTGRFKFDPEGGASSSSESGLRYLILGKAGDKYYAMGNVTNADGSRNAVEVTLDSQGIVETNSGYAEFLTYDYDNGLFSYLVDGQVLSLDGGKIFTYDKAEYNSTDALSRPATYNMSDYEAGTGYMYTYDYLDTRNEYLGFDAENLRFTVSREQTDSLILFRELCPHNSLQHTPAKNPTCTEQGVQEYWYCGDENCWNYYQNGDLVNPVRDGNPEQWTKKATGHSFNGSGICDNCGMARPVYTQLESLSEFDGLTRSAYYMIVVKDGEKTYAVSLPPVNPYEWTDEDGNGVMDALELDENEDGIPDLVVGVDLNEDGTEDYLQDQSGDEVVDRYDWELLIDQLSMRFYEDNAERSNFVEVTLKEDGTIAPTDEGAAEMQMVPAGLWGGSPYNEEELEMEGIDLTTTRVRALYVPNYWVASNGYMGSYAEGEFSTWRRVYGDNEAPGTRDGKNWRISFNADGTVNMIGGYEDSSVLRFVKYTNAEGNPDMTFVDMNELDEEYSEIMLNKTEVLPVYLFAAAPVGDGHTCEFGDWEPDEGGNTHTRSCECGETETKPHGWGEWTSTGKENHTAECDACGATKTEIHNWDEGVVTKPATTAAAGEKTYTCLSCGATKITLIDKLVCNHVWSAWQTEDANNHKRTCTNEGCQAFQRTAHTWDAGVQTQAPSETTEGVTTYTCTACQTTREEPIPMLAHTHNWSEWTLADDDTHIRSCTGANCTVTETAVHTCESWTDNGNGTHSGVCSTCNGTLTKSHSWSDWAATAVEGELARQCACGAKEIMAIPTAPVNTTDSSANDVAAELVEEDVALINKALTDEEQTAMAEGSATVSVYLEVTDVPEEAVSDAEKAAAEEALEQSPATPGNTEVGMYLDIDLFKEVTTSGRETTQTKTSQITETAAKVTITIQIPEELIDKTTDRVYRIVRVHEDENGNLITDVIEGEFDAENGTFTFQTDKFSTYALVYTDPLAGDADSDGVITANDAGLILQSVAGWEVTVDTSAADVDGDGVITANDAGLILQHVAGWDVTLQ